MVKLREKDAEDSQDEILDRETVWEEYENELVTFTALEARHAADSTGSTWGEWLKGWIPLWGTISGWTESFDRRAAERDRLLPLIARGDFKSVEAMQQARFNAFGGVMEAVSHASALQVEVTIEVATTFFAGLGGAADDIFRWGDNVGPRKGLVNVVEESSDNLGRWFVRYGDDGAETFSARLLNGTDELGVAWTKNVRQIAPNIAEIQGAIGRNILRIAGTASDGLEAAIKAGRFNSDLYARQLSHHLGGRWKVESVWRSGVSNEIWDIIATRIGGWQ